MLVIISGSEIEGVGPTWLVIVMNPAKWPQSAWIRNNASRIVLNQIGLYYVLSMMLKNTNDTIS